MAGRTPSSFLAYSHIGAFFRARGMAPADDEYPELEVGKFLADLALRGYRRVIGHNPDRSRYVVILLLGAAGKYATQKPALVNLLNATASEPCARAGKVEEMIVLIPKQIFDGKKNITGVTPLFQKAAQTPGLADPKHRAAAPYYSTFPYELLLTDLLASRSVVPHAIARADEIRKLRDWLNISKGGDREIPWINDVDPVVVWLGARPGQIVKISKPSRQTGVSCEYRYVRATRKK